MQIIRGTNVMPDLIGHLVVITLLLSSCTKAPSVVGFSSSFAGLTSESPIEFALADGATKSLTPITSLPALAKRDFSVSARYTPEGETFDVPGGTSIKYFENHRFGYITNNPDGDSYTDSWRGVATHAATTGAATADPVYWPLDGSLTFFCYAPYHADATLATPPVPDTRDIVLTDPVTDDAVRARLPGYLIGSPVIRYTPAASSRDQVDFLAASPILDVSRLGNSGRFSLGFDHRLTQVKFAFNYDGYLPSPEFACVTSIEVRNVVSSAYLYFTEPTPYVTGCSWSTESSLDDPFTPGTPLPTASYRLTDEEVGGVRELIPSNVMSSHIPEKNGANDNHLPVCTDEGILFLLPQTLSNDAELEVGYVIAEQHGVPKVTDVLTVKLRTSSMTAWPAGKQVRYLLTLNIPNHQVSGISAQLSDWEDAGNTHTAEPLLPHTTP